MTSQIMYNQNGMRAVMLNSEFSLCGLISVFIRPEMDTMAIPVNEIVAVL